MAYRQRVGGENDDGVGGRRPTVRVETPTSAEDEWDFSSRSDGSGIGVYRQASANALRLVDQLRQIETPSPSSTHQTFAPPPAGGSSDGGGGSGTGSDAAAAREQQEHARTLREELESHAASIRADLEAQANEAAARLQAAAAQAGKDIKARTAGVDLVHIARRGGFTFDFFSKEYLMRFSFSMIIFMATAYIVAVAATMSGYRTPNIRILDNHNQMTEARHLPDMGHDLVSIVLSRLDPNGSIDWEKVPDLMLGWSSVPAVAFMLVHPKRFMILRRFFMIYAGLNLLRAFCVTVTSLPDSSPNCTAQFGTPAGAYKDLSPWRLPVFRRALLMLIEPGKHISCGDMIFSGHMTFVMMCCKVFIEYCYSADFHGWLPKSFCRLVRWTARAAIAFMAFAIVATHLHYTLDVAIALYLVDLLWKRYHYEATVDMLHSESASPMMRWLEAEEVLAVDTVSVSAGEDNTSLDLLSPRSKSNSFRVEQQSSEKSDLASSKGGSGNKSKKQ